MDWSSLLSELVVRVAGILLDTADLDYYMALRAVCHNWRATTDDPTDTMHRRFRPHNWVLLDYPSYGEEDCRLLANTETGRFHIRDIPMLRNCHIVCVTVDGLLVLAGKAEPHPARVLNPFTGHMVRFTARMLPNVLAAAVSGSSPPNLVLYCQGSQKLYRANPGSEEFVRYKKKHAYPLVRNTVHGCVALEGHQDVLPPLPAPVVAKIADLVTSFALFPDDQIVLATRPGCFVVQSAGETLVIFKLENRRVEVLKMAKDGNTLEQVKSIGNRAIFIGGCSRCLSLDADKFPSIEANCIYFTAHLTLHYIDIYRLKDDGEQGQGAAPSVNLPTFLCNPLTAHPFTIISLFSIYTLNRRF